MKIGILTMHKVLNYGSFLQAYSLKTQLEKRGAQVVFLDINKGKQIMQTNNESVTKRIGYYLNTHCLSMLRSRRFTKRINEIHRVDIDQYLITDRVKADEQLDAVIIGSDEVFNCCAPTRWGFSRQLMGEVENTKKVYSYAASCGQTTYEKCVSYHIDREVQECLSKFNGISVRDENTRQFVYKILQIDPEVHLDPVFLTDYSEAMPDIPEQKPFLIVYAYSNRIVDKDEIRQIKEYAKEHDLEILCVGQPQWWCRNNLYANCFEMLSYFKEADAVITDTFHGTVFSIIFNKRFGALVRKSNKNKLEDLLRRFHLEERIINGKRFMEIMEREIDYASVNHIWTQEKKKAFQYIDGVLNSVTQEH